VATAPAGAPLEHTYEVIAAPPSSPLPKKESVTCAFPGKTRNVVGGCGTPIGVTDADGNDSGDAPAAEAATTVNV
jgi:hypothetical protein